MVTDRKQGSEFRVQGAGFRGQGSGYWVQGSGFRVQGAGFRVQGSGVRVQGSGVVLTGDQGSGMAGGGVLMPSSFIRASIRVLDRKMSVKGSIFAW